MLLGICRNFFKGLSKRRLHQLGEMSISQKKNKDTRLLRNWWPIALLNIDYKIATKCTAKRLKKVLPRERAMSKIALLERKHSVDY